MSNQEEQIIRYEIQPKTKKQKAISKTNNNDIDKKIDELNNKIAKLQEIEKEKQDRIEQKKLLREEKQKQKELDKIEKQKKLEEKQKQKDKELEDKIKNMINQNKQLMIKNKIDEIDTYKTDIQNFHIQRHNQIRRLNLNF